MPEPRDMLAQIINEHRANLVHDRWTCSKCPDWTSTGAGWNAHEEIREHIADVILAAGWQPRGCVVTSAADLDALQDNTIIRTRYGTAAQKVDEAWEIPNEVGRCLSEAIDLPATVLWSPEEAQ